MGYLKKIVWNVVSVTRASLSVTSNGCQAGSLTVASIHSVTAQSGASGPDKTTRHKDKEKKPRHKDRYNHTQSGAYEPDKTRHPDTKIKTIQPDTETQTNTKIQTRHPDT